MDCRSPVHYSTYWFIDNSQLTPPIPNASLENGYLYLTPKYLVDNPKFRLSIPLKPRLLSPHPYTNQDIVALARGPIVYCIEGKDNTWVDDHFKVRPPFHTPSQNAESSFITYTPVHGNTDTDLHFLPSPSSSILPPKSQKPT